MPGHPLGIVGHDVCAGLGQQLGKKQGDAVAHVVRLRLERQAEEGNPAAAQAPAGCLHDLCHHAVGTRTIDGNHGLDDRRRAEGPFADVDHGQRVLGKAGATVSGARLQEGVADAVVASHAAGDVLDVAADLLAKIRHLVDEAYLRGEERIGGIFDEFGRDDVSEDELDALLLVRPVNFFHHGAGPGVLGADDDAVRIHEVEDGIALAQEFRVGGDVELQSRIDLGDDPLDLGTGPCGHRRLGDHDGVVVQRPADLLGGGVDKGEVGVAVKLACRRTDGDHHHVGDAHRGFEVGRETQPALRHAVGDDGLQPGLVDRQAAGIEPGDLFRGTVDACDVDACGRQAGAADKADISGSDHSNVHRHVSNLVDLRYRASAT